MADNSAFITGVADGAFEDAFGDLPLWATDEGLDKIEEILSKTLDLQTKSFTTLVKSLQGGSGGSVDAAAAAKSLKDFIDELDEATTKQKKSRKLDDDEEKKKKLRRAQAEANGLAFNALLVKTGENI